MIAGPDTVGGKRIARRIAQLERVFPRYVAEAICWQERMRAARRGLEAGANMVNICRRIGLTPEAIRDERIFEVEPADMYFTGWGDGQYPATVKAKPRE